ncbi:MAG: DNA gyrase inhibitor YacG [Acidobacteriaceae bacterium]
MAKEKKSKSSALRCPTCGTLVLREDEDFPFCSDRCRLIDLGKWASGAYRISSPVLDPEVLEGLDEMQRGGHSSGPVPRDDE